MAYFQPSGSYEVKRLTPQQFEVELRLHSEQSEVKRIFGSRQFQVECSIERHSTLESTIRKLERRNNQIRNELREYRDGGATIKRAIDAQVQSIDEELRKLTEEHDKLVEEKSEWERRCKESKEATTTMDLKLLEAVENMRLLSEKNAGMAPIWNEAAAVLKRTKDIACGETDDGSGGVEVKVFGFDSMMMMEPFLDSLKAMEGCFQKMELQMKDMRRAIYLLSREFEGDGFVDVGALLEVEKDLETWL